ncbi:hypothetical protein [Pseudogulbenkiania ferrooxidans]|uniref:Uncharacterized protein n=1 Tax=Pseudogulbenkiania ferrooxidans 2002 TaxID=279714 RepID=B9Z7G0_9NEIS|nr:hypothetical protein [Pseudogulbenkiania ferrooxidans]EEG07475.1 hypothetical protein FuraDRAFT_3296 [Pseudogulbenkiania ferrooxidans 2002]
MSLRRSCPGYCRYGQPLAWFVSAQVTSALMAIANYLEQQLACTCRYEQVRNPVTRNT